jgi:hypothetical protein
VLLQLHAFALALRRKNREWLQALGAQLQRAHAAPLLQHTQTASAFGDVSVQLHWGDVRALAGACQYCATTTARRSSVWSEQ